MKQTSLSLLQQSVIVQREWVKKNSIILYVLNYKLIKNSNTKVNLFLKSHIFQHKSFKQYSIKSPLYRNLLIITLYSQHDWLYLRKFSISNVTLLFKAECCKNSFWILCNG